MHWLTFLAGIAVGIGTTIGLGFLILGWLLKDYNPFPA